jgi:DNA polymerase III alpha subunit (gram-positive type)
MKHKLFYFDVETTGFDAVKNDILQLAGLIEIDGEVVEEIQFCCQPFSYENISQEALEVNNYDLESIQKFDLPEDCYGHLVNTLGKFVDKYNTFDKFICCGFNVSFDIQFLRQFFLKNKDKYFGSWFGHKSLDMYSLVYLCDYLFGFNLPNHKLKTVAKYFDIQHNAHEAMSDIKVTREIFHKIRSKLQWTEGENSTTNKEGA